MALQFIDFKKRVSENNELDIAFKLKDKDTLSIIINDSRNLEIVRNVFLKTEDYRGKVLVNGIDIRKKSELYLFSDVGLYSNFSLYQNIKFLLKINSIKIKKEELLKYFEQLLLDEKKKYSELETGEKDRVKILLGYLLSRDIFLIDLSERMFVNNKIIAGFLRKVIKTIDKNIVVLTPEPNEISLLMDKVLLIKENSQEYFGKQKDLDIVQNLAVLKLGSVSYSELEKRLPFDFTVVNNKFILEKTNLEAALYYFVSNDIEVQSITDFGDNHDLYVRGE